MNDKKNWGLFGHGHKAEPIQQPEQPEPSKPQHDYVVLCPGCQSELHFEEGQTFLRCALCKSECNPTEVWEGQNLYGGNRVLCGMTAPEQLVWKHPRKAFPINATVETEPGVVAVCMQGDDCVLKVDGQNVNLAQQNLGGVYTDANGVAQVPLQIYYVRKTINKNVPWGCKAPAVEFGSNEVVMRQFQAYGDTMIAEIADVEKFLQWMGYQPCSLSDFDPSSNPTVNKAGKLYKLLNPILSETMAAALAKAVQCNGYRLDELHAHKQDTIRGYFHQLVAERLEKYGLKTDGSVIKGLKPSTAAEDFEIIDPLRYRVERAFTWKTKDVHVHMKDDFVRYADIRIVGRGRIVITDRSRIDPTTRTRWTAPNSDDDIAAKEIGDDVSAKLNSFLPQILQGMMNKVNPHFSELSTFLGYIGTTVEGYLNDEKGSLATNGLKVEAITVSFEQVVKSEALQKSEAMELAKAMAGMEFEEMELAKGKAAREEEMRQYLQNINIVRMEDETKLEIRKIENQDSLENARTQSEINAIQRTAAVEGARTTAEHQAEQQQMDWHTYVKQRSYEEVFEDWRREDALEEAKQQVRIRHRRTEQTASLEMERERVQHEEAMKRVLREIEQSDLDWQQKLDAYARLQRRTAQSDELEMQARKANVDAEARYTREHMDQRLSQEASQMMQEAADRESARQERAEQAKFARAMAERQVGIAYEMEKLRMQRDAIQRAEEAAKREKEQAAELEKLRLMLDYQLKASGQQLDEARLQQTREALSRQAEAEYARRHEQEEREAKQRQEAERLAREEKTTQRAEELLREMMEIQTTLSKLRLENEKAVLAAQAAAGRATGGEMTDQRIDELQKEITRLVEALHRGQNNPGSEPRKETAAQPAMGADVVAPPVAETYSAPLQQPETGYGQANGQAYGGQPGIGVPKVRTCSYCGEAIDANASVCPKCYRIP